MHTGDCEGQKSESDALELEVEKILSYRIWVLGINLVSSARAIGFLTPEPSPALPYHSNIRFLMPLTSSM